MPKKTKYRRPHKKFYDGIASKCNTVCFGEYGLQAKTGAWITANQIESVRIVLSKATAREGKIWIRIFPHLGKTKKPAEVRMGSGKGNPELWVAVVKKNTVMFELGGLPEATARHVLNQAAYKLPLTARVITR